MFKKKWNACLLTTVMALLIVAILILIKILFRDVKGFEWGSVSDWLSALANVTMAVAAVYAAKKWFNQKKYELAHSLARDLTFTLYEIQNLLHAFQANVIIFTASPTSKTDMAEIKFYIDKICALISKKEKILFDLKRLKWNLKYEFTDINYLPPSIDFETYYCQAEVSYSMYEYANTSGEELEYDIHQITPLIIQYDDTITKFLHVVIPYEDYFDISK
ncbi:hypothetical protein ACQ3G7_02480 [Kosakonia oryzendophytica]|uniref:hypothetical protein n=1 Tax=Kosakonia oryzendophytica TaxID=1005665 RepID=UPI003D33689B